MEFSFSVAQHGNLYPLVYNCLCSLPDNVLHHTEHGLRHPLGIYSLSIGRVMSAFREVLDENDKIYQTPMDVDGKCNFEMASLLKAQQELLDALMAHIDDCYQIMKALYPANRYSAKKVERFADRWLKQANHPMVEQFKDQIRPYRETFAPIDNKIKHEHGRLRAIVMRNLNQFQDSRARIAGYFVEGVDNKEVVCPDLKIHEGKFAISFHHDLRYHFVHVYIVGHFLANALVDAINEVHHTHFKPDIYVDVPQHQIEEVQNVAKRIAQLPFLFYMNEVVKPMLIVKLVEVNEDIKLTLNNEAVFKNVNEVIASIFSPYLIDLQYQGDSVTRSWKLPYQGLQLSITVNERKEIEEMSIIDHNK